MIHALQSLLNKYELHTADDCRDALREIIQQIALLGLWRTKFFEHAAFYGGTALRIFYGLPRYSEDLDFSLTFANPEFSIARYVNSIQSELQSYGFSVKVKKKEKTRQSQIESAFIRADTLQNLIYIESPHNLLASIHKNSVLRVKIEVDIDPPPYADYDMKTLLVPIPHQVKLYSLPDLFAGKIHALLCREWKSRVKGRDYYDFVWFIGQKVPCHLRHLKSRMVQTGHLGNGSSFNGKILKQMLRNKFEKADFQLALKDIRPFIKDYQSLDLWNKSFFMQLAEEIKVHDNDAV